MASGVSAPADTDRLTVSMEMFSESVGGVMRIKRFIMQGLSGVVFVLAIWAGALAQDREQYVISAKAGGVNLVSGEVAVRRQGTSEWRALTSSDDLQNGDVVNTGANARIELLLSPGSYLRAIENSEFELTDSSLDSLRLRLIKGSAIVEASGADGARMFLDVTTPQTRIVIDRKGLYRINLLPDNSTELLVWKGQALVGSDSSSAQKVKDGERVSIHSSRELTTAKFDKKDADAFDLWSKSRSETLTAASRKLSDRALAGSYASYRRSAFWGSRSISGLWIYDPYISGRTFLPFYYGWSSPYGRSYSTGFGFLSHRHSLFGFGSPRHSLPHRSVHHQSTIHRSSPHHRRGH